MYCQCSKSLDRKAHREIFTYLMYGRKAKDRKNPETKPQMWAKLSIQGSKPKEKKNTEMANSLANARHGRSRICQLWNSSTKRQARMPNWLPAGPTWEEKDRHLQIAHRSTKWKQCITMIFFANINISLYLCSIGQEDGRGQVASDATEHVDDRDSEPASQLLYIPQHRHLEQHRNQAVQNSAGTSKTGNQLSLAFHKCLHNFTEVFRQLSFSHNLTSSWLL